MQGKVVAFAYARLHALRALQQASGDEFTCFTRTKVLALLVQK
jgi:hypothetical protein